MTTYYIAITYIIYVYVYLYFYFIFTSVCSVFSCSYLLCLLICTRMLAFYVGTFPEKKDEDKKLFTIPK